jgi:peptidoglycan/xylan/chitin deacetylase (PgdA/CDA1 family)
MSDAFMPASPSSWPAGHRATVTFCVLVDGTASSEIGIDYSATGLERLVALFADLDLSVSFAWSESALNTYPPAIRRIADLGHEIAAWHRETDVLSPSSLRAALARVAGTPVPGSVALVDINDDDETAWRITGVGGDVPSMAPDATGGVVLPVSPYWSDRTWLHPERPLPPSSMLEAWSLSLAEIRTIGGLMTVFLHPHIIARPGFSGTLTRFLDEVFAAGDVWVARAGLVADWWAGQTHAR